ncbi:MAG: serine/threonine protein kinase [Deltaproteobacteria bacterium]|nr:serine/threonine protein kinase [Deltaproteobacteria bacterium]
MTRTLGKTMVETNAGTLLAGKYRVERVLGTGGMGVVVAALHEQLDERVAIKLLRSDRLAQQEAVERALREARATVKIQSDHVVRVFDVGTLESGAPYIVMEYLSGCDLAQLLCAEGKLDIADAASYVRQACDAVVKAHALGIVHRDLKPANLFLAVRGDDTSIKVLDFGISKFVSTDAQRIDPALTTTASVLGSPAYMSPEQLESPRDIDGRTDVWSLGVILFELITGAHPFVADTLPQLYKKIATAPAPLLRSIRPDAPADLEAIVARCLSKDAKDRFADAAALADALAPFAGEAHGHTAAALAETAMASSAEVESARLASKISGQPPPGIAIGIDRTLRRRKQVVVGGIAAAAAGLAAVTLGVCVRADSRQASKPQAQPAVAPLAKADSLLACPQLVATGVEQPTGWLGASAASIACAHATARMGGKTSRTLVPADLLDLPRAAIDGFPEDAFGDPKARERSVAAARTRAQAWLDGDIARDQDGFHVTLVLRAGDRELARGTGQNASIVAAIQTAMQPLDAWIPAAPDNDPVLRTWYGATTAAGATALADWSMANRLVWPDTAECDALLARTDLLPIAVDAIRSQCATTEIDHPARDITSPGAFIMSLEADGKEGARPIAEDLARVDAMLATAKDHDERALLLTTKADIYSNHRDYANATLNALAAINESPKAFSPWIGPWNVLSWVRANSNASPASLAWSPWNAEVYCFAATRSDDPEKTVEFMRRNTWLSNGIVWQEALAEFLVRDGRNDEARAVAAKMPGDAVQVYVEAGDGKFAAATKRALEVEKADAIDQATYAAWALSDIGLVTGKPNVGLPDLVTRLLDKHPELVKDNQLAEINLSLACATASRDVAHHCLQRMREITGGVVFFEPTFLDGADAYADGNFAAAARAWRPLVARPDWHFLWMHDMLAIAFEKGGDPENAARIDARYLSNKRFNGVEPAHVREALRAEKRGDVAKARELAKKVIDAWSVADTDVPAVAEMRKLVARLDSRPGDRDHHTR